MPVTEVTTSASLAASGLRKAADTHARALAKHELATKGTDAKKLGKAAKDLEAAQASLAAAVSIAVDVLDWADFFLPDTAGLVEKAMTEAAATLEDTELLKKLEPWSWDPAKELEFLATIQKSNPLAFHCGSRILLLEGKPVFPPLEETSIVATRNLLVQAALWTHGTVDKAIFKPDEYFGYGQDISETLALLEKAEPGIPSYTDETPEEALEVLGRLEETIRTGQTATGSMQAAIEALMGRAQARLRVRIYQYDTETQQDRREISDVYLKLDRPAEAARALERVLAVNPSDILSVFTLGRALDLSGDWHKAMDTYRFVYDLNPRFENAVSSYNRLARTHASLFSSEVFSTVDSNESRTSASVAYQAPLNSSFSIKALYGIDHRKLHAPVLSTFPESMTLHTIEMTVPYKLQGTGFSVTGTVGGTLQNKLDDFLPASVADITAENIAEYFVVAPRLGASVEWQSGGLSVGGESRFNQITETFYKDRIAHYELTGKLFASYYHETPSRSFARTISGTMSLGGAFDFNVLEGTQSNDKVASKASITVGSMIASRPMTTLDLSMEGSWQDSSMPSMDDYYTPVEVLTLKGGPKMSIRFGSDSPVGLSVSAHFWPGLYSASWSGVLSLDGGLAVELEKRGNRMYLNLDGTYNAPETNGTAWWSGSVSIGAKIALGDYIIP